MECLDARRLTGPNVLMDPPGSVLDVACGKAEGDALLPLWSTAVRRMAAELGWKSPALCYRPLNGGLSLACSAPIDALYAATEVNEWAFNASVAQLTGEATPDYDECLAQICASAAEESNAALLSLQRAASQHGVTLLWDDDEVSLGMGASARTWGARELPRADSLDFHSFRDIPLALVTGTNGKTTTARLVRHIALSAGLAPGLSSTDWIAVGETIVDRGDWSGPGGARKVLRHADADIAILETARGGLLRRGLGVERADVAVITNIAEDHLGDFGSRNLNELLDIKWIVTRAVQAAGTLVLNADDPLLVHKARDYAGRICWFSLDVNNEIVRHHVAAGGTAFVLSYHDLVEVAGATQRVICRDDEIPITLDGAARHNVANALAAAAVCRRLGMTLKQIAAGLRSVSQAMNPGRCNVYTLPHCRVLVDFAHNPHALQALFDVAEALPAQRRILAFGQAGDRTDEQIRELAASAWSIGLDHVIVSELEKYARGREPGEVFGLIREALLQEGARPTQVEHHEFEMQSLEAALTRAQHGDLIIMLALADADSVRARLAELATAAS
ncbi:MAG: Mur ligase family protein [Woeseia sp.]